MCVYFMAKSFGLNDENSKLSDQSFEETDFSNFQEDNIINNLKIYKLVKEDLGVSKNFTDCWSNNDFCRREQEYTSIYNNDKDKIILFLQNSNKKRFILSDSFLLTFNYIEGSNISLRFANLGNKFLDIKLDPLNLYSYDVVKIEYMDGIFKVYKNDILTLKKYFKLKKNLGYFSWRISKNSYINFNDFKLYSILFLYEVVEENNIIQKKFHNTEERINNLLK